jgi:hypothetical protein
MDDERSYREMRIKPKFYESLRRLGATDFEMAAFGYLGPAEQVMAWILIDDGMPISEALDRMANRQRRLER